jgi:hypothetical protein
MKTIKLPPNHNRVISVTAKTIEEELNELEIVLTQKNNNSIIRKFIPSFSDEKRKYLMEKINALRKLNNTMFIELNLKPSEITEEQIVKGKIAYLWTVLIDSKANALKGYGDLPDDLAQILDSHIDTLLKAIEEMR